MKLLISIFSLIVFAGLLWVYIWIPVSPTLPDKDGFRPTPVIVPFQPAEVGKTYEMKVTVESESIYALNLDFYVTAPSKYNMLLDNESAEEASYLNDLMGSKSGTENMIGKELGVPASFRVELMTAPDNSKLLDFIATRPKTSSTYMGRSAQLFSRPFPPGKYLIRVHYLEGDARLHRLIGELSFGSNVPVK